jgi:glucan phosphoethanolaminetransferase (alkaline phosphatase superfamily)
MKNQKVQLMHKFKSLLCTAKSKLKKHSAPVVSFAQKHFTRNEAVLFGLLCFLALLDQFTVRYTARENASAVNILISFFTLTNFEFLKDVFCWAALLMMPVLLFGRFSRYVYFSLVVLTTISECAIIFAWANFKLYLDGDWVGIVLASDPKEFSTFFETYGFNFIFFLILAAAATFFTLTFIAVSRLKTSGMSKIRAGIAAAIAILFCIAMPIPDAFTSSPMCRFTANTVKEFTHYRRLAKLKNCSRVPGAVHDKDPVLRLPLLPLKRESIQRLQKYDASLDRSSDGHTHQLKKRAAEHNRQIQTGVQARPTNRYG